MRYSIIIPHKDRLSLLRKLLNSIPEKEQLEILLIDDASDVGIQAELDKLVENRSNLKLIRNKGKESKGAGWARNQGLADAKGDYILFADSDDYFSADAFNQIDSELEKSSSDLIVFKTESEDEHGNSSNRTKYYKYLLERTILHKPEDKEVEKLFTKKILFRMDTPCAKIYKHSFLKKNEIEFEEIHFSNDVLFNTNVVLNAETIQISKFAIYNVLDHSNSLVKTFSRQSFDDRFGACIRFNKEIHKNPEFHDIKSVTGGYIWQSKAFGLKKVIETLKISLKEKVPLFYPVHRYLVSFVMRIFGASKNKARFYLVFGQF